MKAREVVPAGDPWGTGAWLAGAPGIVPVDWPTAFAATPVKRRWLVEPLIEAGRVTDVYSPPKVGKSLLALEIAASRAAGRPVLGTPATDPFPVLYVDMENPVEEVVARLAAIGHGPDDLDRLAYCSFPQLSPLDTPRGGADLLALATSHRAELVVIDTVTQVISGDENSSDTFRAMYRHAIGPLKAAGVAVLRLDHSGKDITRGQRGSSAKSADADFVWLLTDRGGEMFELRRTHSRTGAGADRLTLRRELDPLRHAVVDDGGHEAAVARVLAELDRLGVPPGTARRPCAEALRGAGVKVRNEVLAEAVRVRNVQVLVVPAPPPPESTSESFPRGPGLLPGSSIRAGQGLGDHTGTMGTTGSRRGSGEWSPPGSPLKGEPGTTRPPGTRDADAGEVVAAWVEAAEEASGERPASRLIAQVGRQAKELLTEGKDPSRLVDAARAAGGKGFADLARELLRTPRQRSGEDTSWMRARR